MKLRLIRKQTIEEFVSNNVQSKEGFVLWLAILKVSDWVSPNDIVSTFNSADILGNGTNRIVFNIGGNKYRLICTYHFGLKKVHLFINWLGTHAEYSKICKHNKQYSIGDY